VIRLASLILWLLAGYAVAETSQDGSLNTNNQDSTVNSNNTTNDNSVTYSGTGAASKIPVGSAISPSMQSSGMETCLQAIATSFQTVGFGWAGGKYMNDEACNRRRDALLLDKLNMKVAAISRLCQSIDNWKAMFTAGTPCPIVSGGRLVAGRKSYLFMKQNPELYIPDYGPDTEDYYNSVLNIGVVQDDEESDMSISDRFRSTRKSAEPTD
jgi:hypothetical protein